MLIIMVVSDYKHLVKQCPMMTTAYFGRYFIYVRLLLGLEEYAGALYLSVPFTFDTSSTKCEMNT